MTANTRGGRHTWMNRALIAFGLACVIFYSVVTVHTWRYQRAAKSRVEQMVSAERPQAAREYVPDVLKPLKTGEIIGRVDIPRLKLSAAVAEGDDDKTLG